MEEENGDQHFLSCIRRKKSHPDVSDGPIAAEVH